MSPARITNRKSLLRKDLRRTLKRIEPFERKQKSRAIREKILESPFFEKAANIMVYVAMPEEVYTRGFILEALKVGKRIFVPCVNPRTGNMEIYWIKDFQKDLKRGAYGILEPRRLARRKGSPKDVELVLVPGLGFDKKGGRLGRGAGYFDRFLKTTRKKTSKIGLAYQEQVVKKVPMSKDDVKMDFVITD